MEAPRAASVLWELFVNLLALGLRLGLRSTVTDTATERGSA